VSVLGTFGTVGQRTRTVPTSHVGTEIAFALSWRSLPTTTKPESRNAWTVNRRARVDPLVVGSDRRTFTVSRRQLRGSSRAKNCWRSHAPTFGTPTRETPTRETG
jgi:hypothetical protein